MATFLARAIGLVPTPEPQAAAFTAVNVGAEHSCGIFTDDTIACWGANDSGQTDAPDGYFTAVTAGRSHSCAVRTDGTVTCWGANDSGQTDAPDGYFTAVTAGAAHSCGLRTSITGSGVKCWGHGGMGAWGLSSPPSGRFTAIHVRHEQSCGVRADATIACWGGIPNSEFSATFLLDNLPALRK